MQGNLETSGPVGQVGDWVFIALFVYWGDISRVEMSLRYSSLGRRSVSLTNYHLLGPPAVHPSVGWMNGNMRLSAVVLSPKGA
jgi:amino acid permease